MKCTECNAAVKADSGRFCSHCGAVLPDASRITPYEFMTHSDRFTSVRKHTQYSELMAASPHSSAIAAYFPGVFTIGIGAAAYFVISQFFAEAGSFGDGPEKTILQFFPLLFVAGGLFAFYRGHRYNSAPWQRRIAVVVDERTKVQSSDDRTTTRYYCTVQFEDGVRVEMSTKGKVAGMVTRGDIGVAYSKLDKLVDFKRVDV